MLTKITISNFKSHKQTIVPLISNYTCIIGPNGCGKSNIVEAVKYILTEEERYNYEELKNKNVQNSEEIKIKLEIESTDSKKLIFEKILDSKNRIKLNFNDEIVEKEYFLEKLKENNLMSMFIQSQLTEVDYIPMIESLSETKDIKKEHNKQKEEIKTFNNLNKFLRQEYNKKYLESELNSDKIKIEDEIVPKLRNQIDFLANLRSNSNKNTKDFILRKLKDEEENFLTKLKEKEEKINFYEQKIKKFENIDEKEDDIKNQINELDQKSLENKKENLRKEMMAFVEEIVQKHGENYLKNLQKNLYEKETVEENKINKKFFNYLNTDIMQLEKVEEYKRVKEEYKKLEDSFVFEDENLISEIELNFLPKVSSLRKEEKSKKNLIAKNEKFKNENKNKIAEIETKMTSLKKYKEELLEKTNLEENKEELNEVVDFLKNLNLLKESGETMNYQNLIEYESLILSLETPSLVINKSTENVFGNLLGLLKFESKYTTAITSLLGSLSNAIVTKNRKTSIFCLKKFKGKFNKLIFIDMESYNTFDDHFEILNLNENVKDVLSVVSFDKKYKKLFVSLFRNSFICNDFRNIKDLKKVNYRKISTLEGYTLNSSGIYSSPINVVPPYIIQKHLKKIQEFKVINNKKAAINEKVFELNEIIRKLDFNKKESEDLNVKLDAEIKSLSQKMYEIITEISEMENKNTAFRSLLHKKEESKILHLKKFMKKNFTKDFNSNFTSKQKLSLLDEFFVEDFTFEDYKERLKAVRAEYKGILEKIKEFEQVKNISSSSLSISHSYSHNLSKEENTNSFSNESININNFNSLSVLISETNQIKQKIINLRNNREKIQSKDFNFESASKDDLLLDLGAKEYESLFEFECINCNNQKLNFAKILGKKYKTQFNKKLVEILKELDKIPIEDIEILKKSVNFNFTSCLHCNISEIVGKEEKNEEIIGENLDNSLLEKMENLKITEKPVIFNNLHSLNLFVDQITKIYDFIIISLKNIDFSDQNENFNIQNISNKKFDFSDLKNFLKSYEKNLKEEELDSCDENNNNNFDQSTKKFVSDLKKINIYKTILEKKNSEIIKKVEKMNFKEIQKFILTSENNFIKPKKQKIKVLFSSYNFLINNFLKELGEKINKTYKKLVKNENSSIFLNLKNNQLKIQVKNSEAFIGKENLSGGEKSLVDWNILLALTLVLKSENNIPVIFIDELDSFLDYTNLDSLADFIKEYSKKCQVVVVTHKNRVYGSSDALIGVYKNFEGSSSLLSYKL